MSRSVCRVVKKVACNISVSTIQACVAKTLLHENKTGCATVVFVSPAEITELNKQFRNVNAPTDVLSFPAQTEESQRNTNTTSYLGEIVICPKQVRAPENQEFVWEVCHLVVHGMFHLLGVHHEHSEQAYRAIHQKEVTLINEVLQNK